MSNTTCYHWPEEAWKCSVFRLMIKILASLSLVGSVLLVAFMVLTKKYKLTLQKIVFAVGWTSILFSVSQLLIKKRQEVSPTCVAQGFIMFYSEWLRLSWMVLITLTILFKINRWSNFLSDYFGSVCAFVVLATFAIACLPFINNSYGPTEIWCWITVKGMQLGVWIIPFLVIMCVVIMMYVYIIYNVYRDTNIVPTDTHHDVVASRSYRKEVKKLLVYPVAYLLLYCPIIFLNLRNMFQPNSSTSPSTADFVWLLIAYAFFSSNGLVYSLLYLALLTKREELTVASLQQSWMKLWYGDNFAVENNVPTADQTVVGHRATNV